MLFAAEVLFGRPDQRGDQADIDSADLSGPNLTNGARRHARHHRDRCLEAVPHGGTVCHHGARRHEGHGHLRAGGGAAACRRVLLQRAGLGEQGEGGWRGSVLRGGGRSRDRCRGRGVRGLGIQGPQRTRSGSPANEIIKTATQLGAGLVVVVSGSRGISETVLLGSTAQRVQQYAPCPVLVVRPSKRPRRSAKT
ncbi:universal stress protein [Knoellia sp. CPCC 206453]|uniref:universal stress protein n=1 Tax=Knoellia pratensis TaxID=3404796 RepID=UPI0036230730